MTRQEVQVTEFSSKLSTMDWSVTSLMLGGQACEDVCCWGIPALSFRAIKPDEGPVGQFYHIGSFSRIHDPRSRWWGSRWMLFWPEPPQWNSGLQKYSVAVTRCVCVWRGGLHRILLGAVSPPQLQSCTTYTDEPRTFRCLDTMYMIYCLYKPGNHACILPGLREIREPPFHCRGGGWKIFEVNNLANKMTEIKNLSFCLWKIIFFAFDNLSKK